MSTPLRTARNSSLPGDELFLSLLSDVTDGSYHENCVDVLELVNEI